MLPSMVAYCDLSIWLILTTSVMIIMNEITHILMFFSNKTDSFFYPCGLFLSLIDWLFHICHNPMKLCLSLFLSSNAAGMIYRCR